MRGSIVGLCITVVVSASPARADEGCEALRLTTIEHTLDDGEASSQRWWWGWLSGFTVASATQAIVAATVHDDTLKKQSRMGALTSGIGALTTLALPLPSAFGIARIRALPSGTPAERREKLRVAEAKLRDAADAERLGRSWLPHVGALVVNGAAALFLWRHDDLPVQGLEAFVVGMIVAEAKIFTQPIGARDTVDALDADVVTVSIAPLPGGLALVGEF